MFAPDDAQRVFEQLAPCEGAKTGWGPVTRCLRARPLLRSGRARRDIAGLLDERCEGRASVATQEGELASDGEQASRNPDKHPDPEGDPGDRASKRDGGDDEKQDPRNPQQSLER